MEKTLVSIIIPVYNVESYLPRCVDSILSQTFSNLEVILVDDGSSDQCPALCDQYAEQDSRVRVIHNENGGASAARNAGLRIAQGDYISFVDGDDFIRLDMIEVLLSELVKTGADFIKSNYISFTKQEQIDNIESTHAISLYNPLEALHNFMQTEYSAKKHMKSIVWDALYRRSVFFANDVLVLQFPNDRINEDTYIFPELIFRAKKIAHIDEAFYFYFTREGSVSHSKISIREIQSCDLWEHIHKVVSPYTKEYEHEIACNSFSRYLNILRRLYHSEFKCPYFYNIRKKMLEDQENLIPQINDVRVKRALLLIRNYPLYLLLKRIFGRYIY